MARGQSLYDWCMENGEWGQQLIDEWTGICEDGNTYEITIMTRGTKKKVLWKCGKGHTWYASVLNRTKNGASCPYCSGHKSSVENNLLVWCQSNGDFGQQLINEWTGICDDGNNYIINEIARGTKKKMLWKCSKGHEWYATINSRTKDKVGCPYCSGRQASYDNNLFEWCNSNGSFGKLLISEWTGICNDGNHYRINEVTKASRKIMLWKCSKGHEWYAKINDRTSYETGCAFCNNKGTSYPEQFLYRALKQIYPKTISRGKYQGIEFDITIPEERTCIEYSGVIWHEDRTERDRMKSDVCKEHNIRFIQIYAHTGEIDINDLFDSNMIIYKVNHTNKAKHNMQLLRILEHILKSFGHSIEEVNIKKAQTEAYNFMNNIKDNIPNDVNTV